MKAECNTILFFPFQKSPVSVIGIFFINDMYVSLAMSVTLVQYVWTNNHVYAKFAQAAQMLTKLK